MRKHLYIGVDLGKHSSQIAVRDQEGKIVLETQISNTRESLKGLIRKFQGKKLHFLCEASNKSFWLVDVIQELGCEVKVADAYRLKIISEAKTKTDRLDAQKLSELLWKDYVTEIYVSERERRLLKDYMRTRIVQMRNRVKFQTRLRHYEDRYGIGSGFERVDEETRRKIYEEEGYPEVMRETIESYVRTIQWSEREQKEILRKIKEFIKGDEEMREMVKLLRTLPGIGEISSVVIALEIDRIERFASEKKLWSYSGLVPRVRQSGKRERYGALVKRGNRWLRWIMIECAWVAKQNDPYYANLYQKHLQKRSAAEAIIPVARALLAAVFKVLKERKPYSEIYPQSEGKRREGR